MVEMKNLKHPYKYKNSIVYQVLDEVLIKSNFFKMNKSIIWFYDYYMTINCNLVENRTNKTKAIL